MRGDERIQDGIFSYVSLEQSFAVIAWAGAWLTALIWHAETLSPVAVLVHPSATGADRQVCDTGASVCLNRASACRPMSRPLPQGLNLKPSALLRTHARKRDGPMAIGFLRSNNR